jgi:hypothetical protein
VAEREKANNEVLVVDANILIRAVLGVRVRSLIVKYTARVDFFAPDTLYRCPFSAVSVCPLVWIRLPRR